MDTSRYIVESSTDYAMIFFDARGVIQSWNPGAEHIFGYSAEEAIGQHASILFTHEDRRDGVPESELRQAETEQYVSDTRWLIRKDESKFWAEGSTHGVRDGASLVGYSKVIKDAGERLRLEQLLERINEEKEKFAYTISHDLKEPLRTIRSYTELLQRRYKATFDSDANDFMQFILDAVARMDRLLADILAYSQAGRHDKTRPEPTPSANVLQWALMNVDGMVKQASATVTWDPLPTVIADQNQLMIVFQHLLTNSLKFRGTEPPRIHVSAVRTDPHHWQFEVRDNGPGIDADQTERMFGIFKRLVGRDVPGTGIGLAICRKIIDAHGGSIWMESQPGQGVAVKFTLPAYDN